ncbi:MAG: YchJ family protein [Magnetospirillum sp.]
MTTCPCGSGQSLDLCCAPLLSGAAASSPEALMRSRYTAFTQANAAYLETTLAPEAKEDYNHEETEAWIKEAKWHGLEVRGASEDGDNGSVEFVARYTFRGKPYAHHELASFRKLDGRWVYVDGVMNPRPQQRQVDKVGRNDPCPCGSGKKFKKCCGA